jgi:HK97 family phage major capsid protein
MEKLNELVKLVETKFTEIDQEKETLKKELEEVKAKLEEFAVKGQTPPAVKEKKGMEKKELFFDYLRGKNIEVKALVEDTTGEILVPEDLYAEIIRTLPKINVIRRYATAVTVKGNRLRYRGLTDVAVSWTKLETSATALGETGTPTISEGTIQVRDLYGLIKVGEDLLEDTDVALERLIVESFANAIAEAENNAFINGVPANGEPEGILTNTNVQALTVDTATETFDFDDLIKLFYALPAQYRTNAVWIMNSNTEQTIREFKDTNGRYILQPSVSEPFVSTILGRPVATDEAVPDNTIIFGDLKAGYLIIDKQSGLTVKRLEELFALSGQIGLKVHYRVGGGVIRPEAIKVLKIV